MISFADSVNPEAIPGNFTHAAAYSNGRYAWPAGQRRRFSAYVEIGVFAGSPSQARDARVLDVERFDAFPSDFPPFAAERHAAGHADPTAYCSIDTLPSLIKAVHDAAFEASWRLWLAWWWDRPVPPLAADVLAEVRALTGIWLPAGLLWACQWQHGAGYDTSVLYGPDNFTRPAAQSAASTALSALTPQADQRMEQLRPGVDRAGRPVALGSFPGDDGHAPGPGEPGGVADS